jgi:hypothetical protein
MFHKISVSSKLAKEKEKKKAFGYLIDAFNAKMSIWETYSFFSDETEPTL